MIAFFTGLVLGGSLTSMIVGAFFYRGIRTFNAYARLLTRRQKLLDAYEKELDERASLLNQQAYVKFRYGDLN